MSHPGKEAYDFPKKSGAAEKEIHGSPRRGVSL